MDGFARRQTTIVTVPFCLKSCGRCVAKKFSDDIDPLDGPVLPRSFNDGTHLAATPTKCAPKSPRQPDDVAERPLCAGPTKLRLGLKQRWAARL
jgi:hypothetical protein